MTTSEAIDEFKAAWIAGMAPAIDLYAARVAPQEREHVEQAIGHWLGYDAPTVEPHPERRRELQADPLFQRLAALEDTWWQSRADGE